MIPYIVENWYWIVAGSSTHVYSSASQSYVSVSDSTYLAWVASGGEATPIASEALLYEVLNPETPSAIERDLAEGTIDPTDGGPWSLTATSGKFYPVGSTLLMIPFSDQSIKVIGETKAYDGTDMTVSLRATNATVSQTYSLWSVSLLDSPPAALPSRAVVGLVVERTSSSTHSITVGAGSVMDSAGEVLLTLDSAMSKLTTSLWASGTGNGGVQQVALAGTITATTTAISGSGTAFTTDFVVSQSLTDFTNQGSSSGYGSNIGLTGSAAADKVRSITNATALDTLVAIGGTGAAYGRNGRVGTNGANLVYFVVLVRKDSDGSIDVVLSSATPSGEPDLPSGYTRYRVLAAVTVVVGATAFASTYTIEQPLYSALPFYAPKDKRFVITGGTTPNLPEAMVLGSSTSNTVSTGTNSVSIQRAALTGDVTASANSNTTTIANNAVTNAKAADMAEATFKMRAAGAGTGDPIDGTPSQAKTALAITYADVGVREKLTANRTYYVRTDGSDSNTGLVDSSGGAFLTIGKAIDVAYTLDWDIYRVTVQLGTGSFALTKTLSAPFLSSQSLLILGDTTTPSNCTITSTGNGCQLKSGAFIEVSGVTLTPSGFCSMNVYPGAAFRLGTACVLTGSPSFGWVYAAGGYAEMQVAFTINTSAATCAIRCDGGFIDGRGGAITITLTGTPAWTTGFVDVNFTGVVLFSGKTFSGSATGPRYNVASNGVIFTNAGGASYFPGNAAGTSATGGQYV